MSPECSPTWIRSRRRSRNRDIVVRFADRRHEAHVASIISRFGLRGSRARVAEAAGRSQQVVAQVSWTRPSRAFECSCAGLSRSGKKCRDLRWRWSCDSLRTGRATRPERPPLSAFRESFRSSTRQGYWPFHLDHRVVEIRTGALASALNGGAEPSTMRAVHSKLCIY